MGNKLKDKVAIVTGGGAGIGEAICKKFASEGAKVVVCGRIEDPVHEVVKEIQANGGTALAYQGDISSPHNAQACISQAVNTFGQLDILVNNAGVFPTTGFIEDYPIDDVEYLLQNNSMTTVLMSKYAMPFLQQTKGCVINAGSESGLIGIPQNTPYGGTKGFIHAFTKGLAAEQAQKGVRVNAVCPGAIDTSWTHKEIGPMDTMMEKQIIAATPMGRRGTPEEVANVYLFLASDDASYVTGSLYSVDGGITISKGPAGLMADKSMTKAPKGELDLMHSMDGDPVKHGYADADDNAEYQQREWSQDYRTARESVGGASTLVKALAGLGIGIGLAAAGMIINRLRDSDGESDWSDNESRNRNQNRISTESAPPVTTATGATSTGYGGGPTSPGSVGPTPEVIKPQVTTGTSTTGSGSSVTGTPASGGTQSGTTSGTGSPTTGATGSNKNNPNTGQQGSGNRKSGGPGNRPKGSGNSLTDEGATGNVD
jgi:NAD(P)-dependent dehydrogenase (short-subunit alcohol dehydrogenase family)